MKILVCNKSYPEAESYMSLLLPESELVSCDPADVINSLDGVDVLIPSVARISEEIISGGSFRLIQQLGVGLDSVDIEAATAAGVLVANVPGAGSGNAESVAEMAVMHMLVLGRRLDEARANLARGIFFKPGSMALLNKCACIVGFGDIGKSLAFRLKNFGMRIIAVREHPEYGAEEEYGVGKVYGMAALGEALAQADFVVLAVPETKSTRHLINQETLRLMKETAFLINVGRGAVVDMEALHQALEGGRLAGAGLDVFAEEPVDPQHPIFRQNVVATPHLGGNTDESLKGVVSAIVANVKLLAEGKAPRHTVNKPAFVRSREGLPA